MRDEEAVAAEEEVVVRGVLEEEDEAVEMVEAVEEEEVEVVVGAAVEDEVGVEKADAASMPSDCRRILRTKSCYNRFTACLNTSNRTGH